MSHHEDANALKCLSSSSDACVNLCESLEVEHNCLTAHLHVERNPIASIRSRLSVRGVEVVVVEMNENG